MRRLPTLAGLVIGMFFILAAVTLIFLPKKISERFDWKGWPPYLLNYYKYPVIIDGSLFNKTFHFKPKRTLDDIFSYYREKKEMGIL